MKEILYTILFSALFMYVSSIAFSFFDIGFEVYGNYMLWTIALIVFWSILPQEKSGKIFTQGSSN